MTVQRRRVDEYTSERRCAHIRLHHTPTAERLQSDTFQEDEESVQTLIDALISILHLLSIEAIPEWCFVAR